MKKERIFLNVGLIAVLAFSTAFFGPTTLNAQWAEAAKALASDAAAEDYFGYSVSISGDQAIVGAYQEDPSNETNAGSAYIFEKVNGVWTEQAKLTASDAAGDDNFGYSVSISGDQAIVGARLEDPSNLSGAGSAYIFEKVSGVWTEQAKLTASDAAGDDNFGYSVSISGDQAIVGAFLADPSNLGDAGAAYIFEKVRGVWIEQIKLTASDAASFNYFGYSVSISGDQAIVGAYLVSHSSLFYAGSAYIFEKVSGVWAEQAKLTASDAEAYDTFGWSVSISGDQAIVGAYQEDPSNLGDAGAAYIFEKVSGVWTEQAKLTASDAAGDNHFGTSVSISGDQAIVGAFLADHSSLLYAGSAYIFAKVNGVWAEQAKLTASDAAARDKFGISVSISGDQAIVGAFQEAPSNLGEAGSAYFFNNQPQVPATGLSFDGSNDYVDLPNGLVSTMTDFTVEAYFKLEANNTWSRIIDFGSGTGINMFLTNSNGFNSLPRFAITTTGNTNEQQIDGNTVLNTNQWYHIAVTIDATSNVGTMYIDGVQVGQNTNMTLTPSSMGATTNNWIGRSQYPDPYLNGVVDEVRIWNIARTAQEIMNSKDCELAGTETGLAAYYNFDNGLAGATNSGLATLSDQTSNGNDGTLTNFALTGATSNWAAGQTLTGPCAQNTVMDLTTNNGQVVSAGIGKTITDKTLTAWVKISSATASGNNQAGPVTLQTPDGLTFDAIVYNETNQGWGWGSNSYQRTQWSGVKETQSEWVHMALTNQGNNFKMYRNGVEILNYTDNAISFTSTAQLMMGRRHGNSGDFEGQIDEITLWDKALTQSEIAGLVQTAPAGNEPGLLIYYNFEEGTPGGNNTAVTAVLDQTSNSINATLSGVTKTGSTSNWVSGTIPNYIFTPPYSGPITWDGTQWLGGAPTEADDAVIASSVSPGLFSTKDLTINSGVSLNVGGHSAFIHGNLINNGNGIVGDGTVIFTDIGLIIPIGPPVGPPPIGPPPSGPIGAPPTSTSSSATTVTITGNPLRAESAIQVNFNRILNTNNQLTLAATDSSQGSLMLAGGSVTGDVTVETYLAIPNSNLNTFARKRFMLSPAVENAKVADYQGNAPMTRWDVRVLENSSSSASLDWVSNLQNPFNRGESHIFWAGVNITKGFNHPTGTSIRLDKGTVSLTGPVNFQNVMVNLGYQTSNISWLPGGANFTGNPFPGYYDWDQQSFPSNVNNFIAYYATNDSVTRIAYYPQNGSGINGGTNLIAPGQGFMVFATGTPSGPLVLNSSNVVNPFTLPSLVPQLKKAPDALRLELSNQSGSVEDELVIGFSASASAKVDAGQDIPKLYGLGLAEDETLNTFLAARVAQQNLAIAQFGLEGIESVALDLVAPMHKALTLSANTVDLQRYSEVWLEDTQEGVFVDLKNENYSFSNNANNPNRFTVHFSSKAGQSASATTNWFVYQKDGAMYFSLPANETGGTLQVLNTAGQVLHQQKVNENHTQVLANQASGVYLIRYNGKIQKVVK